MKIKKEKQISKIGGLESFETKSFSIEQNARAFEILSSSLYSDKIEAIIRELGCNAFDAHVDRDKLHDEKRSNHYHAPKNHPFTVKAPNYFNEQFSIRDYGIGLPVNDVVALYVTYFNSTKTDNNDQIGAFGLGSKSPFCYVDQFTVKSYFNGKVHTFNAFKGGDGFPKIVKLLTEETKEYNGLEVILPVKTTDVFSFQQKIEQVFFWFSERPLVEGFEVKYPEIDKTFEGKFWYSYTSRIGTTKKFKNFGSALVKQGNVTYPVDIESFSHLKLSPLQKSLLTEPIVFEVPIGSVAVTASRERLDYNKFTEEGLISGIDNVKHEIQQTIEKEVTNCKNLWDASVIFKKWENHHLFKRLHNVSKFLSVNWKGKEIPEFFELDLRTEREEEIEIPSNDGKKSTQKIKVFEKDAKISRGANTDLSKGLSNAGNPAKIISSDRTIVVLDDTFSSKFRMKLIHNFEKGWGANTQVEIVFVRPSNKKVDVESLKRKIQKQLGGVDIILFSSLPDPIIQKNGKKSEIVRIKKFTGKTYYLTESWEETDVDISEAKWYVVTYGGTVKSLVKNGGLNRLIDIATHQGWFSHDEDIFNVNSSNLKLPEKHNNLVSYEEEACKRLLKTVKTKKFQDWFLDHKVKERVSQKFDSLYRLVSKGEFYRKISNTSVIQTFRKSFESVYLAENELALFKAIENFSFLCKRDSVFQELISYLDSLRLKLDENEKKLMERATLLVQKLKEKYPLLYHTTHVSVELLVDYVNEKDLLAQMKGN